MNSLCKPTDSFVNENNKRFDKIKRKVLHHLFPDEQKDYVYEVSECSCGKHYAMVIYRLVSSGQFCTRDDDEYYVFDKKGGRVNDFKTLFRQ